MSGRLRIVHVPGDGIGPEVTAAARRVLDATGLVIEWRCHQAGAAAWRETGEVVPEATLAAIESAGAALKGPFATPSGGSLRSGNWHIRRRLDLFAGLRPVRLPERGVDLLIVRENVEDLYAAIELEPAPGVAQAVKVATVRGCRRVARLAFETARRDGRRGVTVVHKANNLKLTEGMFLEVAREVARDYPDIAVTDMLADTAAFTLVREPGRLDVLLTSNTFGDILSGVAAGLAGSPGLVPSLNVGERTLVAEGAHGAAPELAGTGRANPVAMIRAAGMLLRALGRPREAAAIGRAVDEALAAGVATPDAGGGATTAEVAASVAGRVSLLLQEVSR